jgi:two-component system response regulator CpxR
MNNHILLFSDQLDLSQTLINDLREHECVLQTASIEDLNSTIGHKVQHFSLVVFDLHSSKTDIPKLLDEFIAYKHLHFLVLSPSEQEQDCLDAFQAGTDDYLKKPFVLAECVARIKALLRRSHYAPVDEAIITHGALVLNCLTRQATLENKSLSLTNSQFNILEIFLRYPGRVLSKEQLTEYSLGRKYTAYDRSIDVHVSNLRHKLGMDQHDESWIQTVRGYGYAFVAKG